MSMKTRGRNSYADLRALDSTHHDPREGEGDRAVREALGDYVGRLLALPELFGPQNIYQGMDTDRRPEDELGLQLADVIAQVRDFFRSNPDSLTVNSTLDLITPDADEPLNNFWSCAAGRSNEESCQGCLECW